MADLTNHAGRLTVLFMVALAILSGASLGAAAMDSHEQVVSKSEWPEYANGANLAALPQLRQILGRFDERDGNRIEIRYPGGDGGEQWARQIQQWFIAYGVPDEYLDLAPGSGAADQLLIILVQR